MSNEQLQVDWGSVRRRIDRALQALDANLRDGDQDVGRVLRERASALAKPRAAGEAPGSEYLVFRVGRNACAVEARYVAGVSPLDGMSPLPGAVLPIAGVIAWRGSLITLLAAHAALGLTEPETRPRFALILVRDGGFVAIAAADVDGVRRVPFDSIRPLALDSGASAALVTGATPDAVVILNAPALARLHL